MTKRDLRLDDKMRVLALAAACAGSHSAYAFELDTADPDLYVRWDNTVKYSAAWRVKDRSAGLTSGDPFASNFDDGDRNFDKGLISNRLDLLSELDLVYKQSYGFRISGAGWYDDVYNKSNDNDSPATSNRAQGAYDEFSHDTRDLHGRKAELLDAFVFGGFDIGSTRLNLRLGQHSLQWGETLYFGANGIAGAMAPVDVIKLTSVPGTQFKEAILPVPQISAQWQLTDNVSLGAFYQLRWDASRLPAAGSYFSGLDFQPEGGEEMLFGPLTSHRISNQDAKNSGQGGLQLRFTYADTDFGLYLVRFHSKTHQLISNLGLRHLPDGSVLTDSSGAPVIAPVSYRMVYNEGITAFGASASHTFGPMQVSTEASIRHNQDLATSGGVDLGLLTGTSLVNDNHHHPAYATGKTAHFNISTIWTLPSTALAREATFTGEYMWNRVLSVDKNREAIDPNATRDASAVRFVLEPTYRQVLSGLDLSVPIGVGYSPKGSRSMALGPSLPAEGGGDFSVGVNGNYLGTWNFSLAYNHFFGPERPFLAGESPTFGYGQYLKDRDFVAMSVRRTF
ncbi:conserved exported protein of unknown function [Pseudomonas sp. JV551A1]|uniref:DUF1302 domain-containing protein n=2 Tax=Pseudomonas TaxID=286 RepID=A0AAQ1PA64_9PSED|nr:conserved exported protein of unknown function [Pseudomonas sp. JV551A1]SPO62106.1 conserved exported protein of unknown function [Pseudomonas inefficax]